MRLIQLSNAWSLDTRLNKGLRCELRRDDCVGGGNRDPISAFIPISNVPVRERFRVLHSGECCYEGYDRYEARKIFRHLGGTSRQGARLEELIELPSNRFLVSLNDDGSGYAIREGSDFSNRSFCLLGVAAERIDEEVALALDVVEEGGTPNVIVHLSTPRRIECAVVLSAGQAVLFRRRSPNEAALEAYRWDGQRLNLAKIVR